MGQALALLYITASDPIKDAVICIPRCRHRSFPSEGVCTASTSQKHSKPKNEAPQADTTKDCQDVIKCGQRANLTTRDLIDDNVSGVTLFEGGGQDTQAPGCDNVSAGR